MTQTISHNTVCACTALLKAAELVSSLVLMEAGSTMKAFEIQRILLKVCTGTSG